MDHTLTWGESGSSCSCGFKGTREDGVSHLFGSARLLITEAKGMINSAAKTIGDLYAIDPELRDYAAPYRGPQGQLRVVAGVRCLSSICDQDLSRSPILCLIENPDWRFVHCPKCKSDWTISKLAHRFGSREEDLIV